MLRRESSSRDIGVNGDVFRDFGGLSLEKMLSVVLRNMLEVHDENGEVWRSCQELSRLI